MISIVVVLPLGMSALKLINSKFDEAEERAEERSNVGKEG